jgi:integrase
MTAVFGVSAKSKQYRVASHTSAHRKSIVKEAVDRLDGMMAIRESRGKAKEIAKAVGISTWAFSTGRIHSFKTRTTYQQHVVRFVRWARSTHQVKNLAQLDPQAEALATEWLEQQLVEQKSPYTLQAERAALRLFFSNRELATSVAIPRRARERIRRSRGPAAHDRHIRLANWQPLIRFLQATGLRRNELRALRAGDVVRDHPAYPGQLVVQVTNGKGGKPRPVPTLPGREADVLAAIPDQGDPESLVFTRIPKHLDIHSYRREYAKALYLQYALGRDLPPATGRLRPSQYGRQAAQRVSWALGHNRVDVVLRHYLR